jgi:hypothetical protein
MSVGPGGGLGAAVEFGAAVELGTPARPGSRPQPVKAAPNKTSRRHADFMESSDIPVQQKAR